MVFVNPAWSSCEFAERKIDSFEAQPLCVAYSLQLHARCQTQTQPQLSLETYYNMAVQSVPAGTQKTAATLLILSLLVVRGFAAPRRLLVVDNEAASERQRILAELEEVHQLRERMLQEGKGF